MSNEEKYNKLNELLHEYGVNRSTWTSGMCSSSPMYWLSLTLLESELKNSDSRDEAIKIIIILLVSKIGGVPNFGEPEYGRLYSHIIRKHCVEEDKNPFLLSELPKFSVEEIINEQLIEGGRWIGKDRFVECFNELRSLGHIDDREGRLDTTAFAQFVNAYFFLNEDNHFRIIENLYPEEDNSELITDY